MIDQQGFLDGFNEVLLKAAQGPIPPNPNPIVNYAQQTGRQLESKLFGAMGGTSNYMGRQPLAEDPLVISPELQAFTNRPENLRNGRIPLTYKYREEAMQADRDRRAGGPGYGGDGSAAGRPDPRRPGYVPVAGGRIGGA